MTPTITIQEAAMLLNKKDNRSVKRFCEKNNIPIYLVAGSNEKYIVRMQLEYVQYSKLIRSLKVKYKDEWFEVFHAYMEMNFKRVVEIEEIRKGNISITIDKYKVEGHCEKGFLATLTKIISEQ